MCRNVENYSGGASCLDIHLFPLLDKLNGLYMVPLCRTWNALLAKGAFEPFCWAQRLRSSQLQYP